MSASNANDVYDSIYDPREKEHKLSNNNKRQALSFVARQAINKGYGHNIEAPLEEVLYNFPEVRAARSKKGSRKTGRTPSMYRAHKGNVTGPYGLNTMMIHKTTVNKKNDRGMTSFAHAIVAGQLEAAKYLLDKGANIDEKNYSYIEETPLMLACDTGNAEAVRFLVENGADVNARDKRDRPVIFHAINSIDCMRVLLDNGVDIETRVKENYTTLECAVHMNNVDAVRFLVGRGANTEEALDYAKGMMREYLSLFEIAHLLNAVPEMEYRLNPLLHVITEIFDILKVKKGGRRRTRRRS